MPRWPTLLLLFALLPVPCQADYIEDNSFLVEEAYNQEPGVVQHIQFFQYDPFHKNWAYSFTQEWPVPNQTNQLSYSIPFLRGIGQAAGIGDVLLNYRYQVLGAYPEDPARHDEPAFDAYPVAFAPRLSIVLPTGDWERGNGRGALGVQTNLPWSLALRRRLILHLNVGATWTPQARGPNTRGATLDNNYGGSLVYHLASNFDALVEVVGGWTELLREHQPSVRVPSLFVNPGLRYAINCRGGLQIVPGLCYTYGLGPSDGLRMIGVYLSFEHPVWKPHARRES